MKGARGALYQIEIQNMGRRARHTCDLFRLDIIYNLFLSLCNLLKNKLFSSLNCFLPLGKLLSALSQLPMLSAEKLTNAWPTSNQKNISHYMWCRVFEWCGLTELNSFQGFNLI